MFYQNKHGYGLYFINGNDSSFPREKDRRINVGDIVMVLPDKSFYHNCVVVLCKYGIREIMDLDLEDKWSSL